MQNRLNLVGAEVALDLSTNDPNSEGLTALPRGRLVTLGAWKPDRAGLVEPMADPGSAHQTPAYPQAHLP